MKYKLYTHPNDGSDDPVIVDGDLLPRIEADTDVAAISRARAMISETPDHEQRISSWELTEIDADDVSVRDVYEETVDHGECANCADCDNNGTREATRFCGGCDMNLCEACYILHNDDLDGEESIGFVVINTVNGAVIERDNDPSDGAGFFTSIQDAREVAAEARANADNSDIFVYRVVGVGDTSDDR